MKKIKYETKELQVQQHEIIIDDEEFICVKSWRDGSDLITAFIGKSEGSQKLKIEVSPGGKFLNFSVMAGSAEMNALRLLRQSKRNHIVPKSEFNHWYNIQEKYKRLEL